MAEIGGQWLDEIPERYGVKLGMTSEMMKWEGPDPATGLMRVTP